ncbi:MAG: OPT/YSL family transporter [Elusimicrobiales bacterium]|nr:OPT/YSL family transporter [Elusimicrobiales bacterium]
MSKEIEKAGGNFQPFIPGSTLLPEFTVKSILLGAMFGIIFGASTVYLALKAGLTVSASIPIAVLAISLGRKLFHTTILENNIIQTTGSAGESIAAGVVFTLPGFLFLSAGSNGPAFFNYWTIFTLAMFGGILGTLMMIPLRRSLIVQEHGHLPYPEGTACASVLIAGEKGGDFSKTAYQGLGFAFIYAMLQKVIHVIAEAPEWATSQANKFFPSAVVSGEITPEYMGVGYIIGPKIAGVLVAGGVLAWLGLIPLLASLVPPDVIAGQLVKLGELKDLALPGGPGGWDPVTHTFASTASAVYKAYVRQIGAGAVAAGGFITLLKTLPTIISSFKGSLAALKNRGQEKENSSRTERDLSILTVIIGSAVLVLLIALLPLIPGNGFFSKLLLGLLVIVFGFFFVTVSSRIVGIIGSSSNPISGMTIATIMGTSLIFIAVRWTGMLYEPMVLVVGGMICIAAANAGATSQDLKTGYIVGATPKYQQLALFIGAVVSAAVIGWTVQILDTPTAEMAAQGITHAIGSDKFPAPQGTLMATLIKGLLSFNLDWQFVIVGVFISIVIELCGVSALSFAVGLYLPLSTTLPIFAGGLVRGAANMVAKRKGLADEDADLGKGSLFSTGLVAGGALFGVVVAIVTVFWPAVMDALNCQAALVKGLGQGGYELLGALFFLFMGGVLFRIALKR